MLVEKGSTERLTVYCLRELRIVSGKATNASEHSGVIYIMYRECF